MILVVCGDPLFYAYIKSEAPYSKHKNRQINTVKSLGVVTSYGVSKNEVKSLKTAT